MALFAKNGNAPLAIKKGKDERIQVIIRAITKLRIQVRQIHNGELKMGLDIDKDNDVALRTQIDYGRIRIQQYQIDGSKWESDLICLKCNYATPGKGSIKGD